MSILSRLCRYVHTHGYSASVTEAAVPTPRRAGADPRRQRYARACLEQMEPRVLLTTLTNTGPGRQNFSFFDLSKKDFTVTLTGNITVELYGSDGASLVDLVPSAPTPPPAGVDIFAMYITSSDISASLTITGVDIQTGGPGSLYTGTQNVQGRPIAVPNAAGQIWIGQLANQTPITNVPVITVPGAGPISPTALALATNTTGFDGTNFISGIYSANSIGKILVDGTVTGNVAIEGSVGTFYAGWLLTGDATGNGGGTPDNFNVTGDIANLLVHTSVGTEVTTVPNTGLTYDTFTQIHAGGKIGTISVGDALVASVTADDNVTSNSLVNLGYVWQEPTTFVLPNNKANRVFTFSNLGLIPITAGDAFFNGSFATADYVGALDVTNGQQSITLQGTLQGFINNQSPNPVDYYAFGLLAGQTVTVSEATNPSTPLGAEELGVFDPDGRLIFTGAANASGFVTATFTADRPGAYRIAAGLPGDLALSGNPSLLTDVNYTLSVTGVGNLAVGGIKTRGDLLAQDSGISTGTGDLGAVVSNANLLSSTLSSVNVSSNLRVLEAASIGRIVNGFPNSVPNISVGGQVGLIHGSARMLANVSAGGNIQLLDSEGDMEGTYTSNASIGVVRAATLSNNFSSTLGLTVFSADANGIGNDGIIDLIDVSGDLGSLGHGGPRIETGIGGNVRFIHVGGSIFQDPNFGGGGTSTGGTQFGDGGIIHAVGEAVPVTDDSGSQIMLTPSPAQTVTNPVTGVVTVVPAGQITTYSYGIFGTGGSVLVKVVSTRSLTITSSSGNFGGSQSAEVGEIDMTGAGAALTTTAVGGTPLLNANGTPVLNANGTAVLVGGVVLPANDATAVASSLNTLSIVGAIATSVFSITDPFTLNRVSDNTGGDIVNMTTGDIGTLTVAGNLGSTHSTTGAVLNQSAVIAGGNTYPFEQQHTGLVVGNVVSISTNNAVGNIIANGNVGSITADAGGTAIKGALEGITGPILVNGNLGTIRIGNGVASSGLAPFSATSTFGAASSRAGIYVGGTLINLIGSNADIRGQIIAFGAAPTIDNISLSNGSLIGAEVGAYTTLAMASFLNRVNRTLPELGTSVTNPVFNIQKINITGDGGIIGSAFGAADIGTITVAPTGFGILNSDFNSSADGVLKSLTAGGYGIRQVFFNGNRVNALNATGNGAIASLTQFSNRVRSSEGGTIDPYTGVAVSSDTDLDLFMKQVGLGDSDFRTGVIGNSNFVGQNLGNITAFTMEGAASLVPGTTAPDTLDFSNSIGSIKLTGGISNIRILTGSLGTFVIGGNATGLDLEFAGTLGTMVIAGNYVSGLIFAKGPSSSIKSLTVGGNFAGTLVSQGFVNTLIIGTTSKKKGVIGGGNFTGSIKLLGGSSAKNLVFASGFSGDFEISGNVGAISFLQGLASTSTLVVHGNLGKLTIGGDKNTDIGLRGNVTIQGTLGQLLGGGAFTGTITTTGNLSKVLYTGSIAGTIIANGSIGLIKLTGDIASAGSFTAGGNIAGLTIKGGALNGRLTAGSIGTILVPAIGANAKISTNGLNVLTVQGNTTGGTINVKGAINTLTVGGSLTGAHISAGSINKMSASALTNAVVTAGQAINSLKVKGAVTSSVVQSGITPGNDGIFGTHDAGEIVTLGTLGIVTVGSMSNSVIDAGGSIGTFVSGGLVDSSVSSGLVVDGAALQNVVAGTNPLATPANVQTLRSNPTLFFGNIGSINIGNGAEGALDANSAISAGVSPGPNGIFGDPSDSAIAPAAVGTSTIFKLVLAADALPRVFVHNPA